MNIETKLSKHLQECLQEINAGKDKTFEPIDFYPRIKRGDWVFKKLEEAGFIRRFKNKFALTSKQYHQ